MKLILNNPCEIKSRIAMAKAAFSKKKTLFTSKLDLNLRKKHKMLPYPCVKI